MPSTHVLRPLSVRTMVFLVTALALVGGLAWGFTTALGQSASPAPAGKTVLHVGWTIEPDNLNPFIGYATSSYEIWHLNYDLLYGYSATNFAPVPELAADMPQVSPDGLTATVKLRPHVTWQDGVPFTARDVAFTYNFIIKNDIGSMSGYTRLIKYPVVASDDLTVVFHFSKPKANFLRMWIPIVPEHIWSHVSPKAAQNSYVNKPPIIGTGPFQTVEVVKGNFVKMEANKHYWRGAPKIDEIVFSVYQNADNMAADLKAGKLDVAWDVPPAQMKILAADPDLKAIAYPTRTFDYVGINSYDNANSLGNPVLRDEKFRQALAWAINKQQIVQMADFGFGTPGDTVIVGCKYGAIDYHYEPPAEQKVGFDPAKARALLDAAGYKLNAQGQRLDKHGKPIVLRLWARTQSDFSQEAGRLITGWFRSLGLKIDFSVMDEGAINDRLYNLKGGQYAPDYDMYIWDWFGYADPGDTLVSWTTPQIYNGWNDCCWSNKQYDALFAQQETAVDLKTGQFDNVTRRNLIWQMQDIFYRSSPYIVLEYPYDREAYNVAKWDGWVRPNNEGVIMINDNIDTYLMVHPKAASAASGTSSNWVIGVIVAVAVVAAVVVFLVVRRRRGPAEEV